MRVVIGIVFVLCFSGLFTDSSAQLPPEIMADKYLMQAEQLLEKKDFDGALKLVERIIAMQKEHGFALRDEFHFKHAKIAYAAGMIQTAIDAVSAYLSAGSKGEFYKEALALLIKAEEEMQETEIIPDKTCAGMPETGSCWMALADRPGCYAWNPYPKKNESVTWSGRCAGNTGRGEGTLTSTIFNGYSLRITSTGRLRKGKMHGSWVNRRSDGFESEGTYTDGKRQGHWVQRYWDGSVTEGSYTDGKRHGNWISRISEGDTVKVDQYVDGVMHGVHIYREFRYGRLYVSSKGEYVQGKAGGAWLFYFPEKKICESIVFRQDQKISERRVSIELCQREEAR